MKQAKIFIGIFLLALNFFCQKEEPLWLLEIKPLPVIFDKNKIIDTLYTDTFNLAWTEKSTLPDDIFYDIYNDKDTLKTNIKDKNFPLKNFSLNKTYSYKVINRRKTQGLYNQATYTIHTQHDSLHLNSPINNVSFDMNKPISFSWKLHNRFFSTQEYNYIVYLDTNNDFRTAIKIDKITNTQIQQTYLCQHQNNAIGK